MIKLTKCREPDVLVKNRQHWTEELLAAIDSGDKKEIDTKTRRYNHPDVKSCLKVETNEKCAYCEARVTDVAHGDIEHISAKSLYPLLTFTWENLTFACQKCNQAKSDKDNILNPYTVDPVDHIIFVGAFATGASDDGLRTVLELDLNRVSLIESRNREIERYAGSLQTAFIKQNQSILNLVVTNLLSQLDTGRPEFIAACRSAIVGSTRHRL